MGVECASCGAQNRDGAKFCKACGHRLVVVAVAANDRVAPAEWPITERMPLPEAVAKRSSSAADETTVAIGRSPAPPRVPTRPAPLPPSPTAARAPKAASRPATLSVPAARRRSRPLWSGFALLLVAIAAAAWYTQSQRDAVTPAVSQTPAAAGPVAMAPPAPAREAAPPAPAPQPAPPTQIAQVPAEEPLPVPQAKAIAEPPASTSPPAVAPPPAKAEAPAKPVAAAAPKAAAAAAPKPRKAPPAAPTTPVPQPAPAPATVVATAPAEPVAPPSPEATCAGQGFFGRSRCMVAQCAKPELRAHAQCDAVRRQQQIDEEKRNPSLAN